jgi:hypothetical protein
MALALKALPPMNFIPSSASKMGKSAFAALTTLALLAMKTRMAVIWLVLAIRLRRVEEMDGLIFTARLCYRLA